MNVSSINITLTDWRWTGYVAAGIPILALALTAVALNALILIRFCRNRHHLSVNMKMTFSLAASDLWASSLVALGLLGNSLLPIFFERDFNELSCLLLALEAGKLGAILTSVLHLLALAANQCFSIVQPFRHKVLVTSRVCRVVLICIWLWPASGFLLYFEMIDGQGFRSTGCENLFPYQMQNFRAVVFCVIATPMLLMITIYGVIWYRLINYKSKNSTSSFTASNTNQDCREPGRNYRGQRRAIFTTTIIVGTFIVSWFPSIMLYLLVCLNCVFRTYRLNEKLVFALSVTKTVLILAKLLLNPLIYSWRFRIIRDNDNIAGGIVRRLTNISLKGGGSIRRDTSDSGIGNDGKLLRRTSTFSHT